MDGVLSLFREIGSLFKQSNECQDESSRQSASLLATVRPMSYKEILRIVIILSLFWAPFCIEEFPVCVEKWLTLGLLHGLYISPLQIAPEKIKLDRTVVKFTCIYKNPGILKVFFLLKRILCAGEKVAQGYSNPFRAFYFFAYVMTSGLKGAANETPATLPSAPVLKVTNLPNFSRYGEARSCAAGLHPSEQW